MVFHVLPGNRNWLLSLPELSKAGFDFFLTDRGPSLMFPPSGDPVVLRRTSGSSGFWSVEFDFPTGPGVMRILNDRYSGVNWTPYPSLNSAVRPPSRMSIEHDAVMSVDTVSEPDGLPSPVLADALSRAALAAPVDAGLPTRKATS